MFHHRGLDRVQPAVRAAQMLDGDDVAAVAGGEEADAGVHRLIDHRAVVQAPDQHRAGAAVALGAAFLGAGEAPAEAQEIQQRVAGTGLGQLDFGVVQKKTDHVGDAFAWVAHRMTQLRACTKRRGT